MIKVIAFLKATSANVVTGGCMTKEALDFIRAML
jgi:hypothetical protein